MQTLFKAQFRPYSKHNVAQRRSYSKQNANLLNTLQDNNNMQTKNEAFP